MYAPGGENKFNQEELASANSSVMVPPTLLPPPPLILVRFNQALYLQKWLWVLINYLSPKIDELLQPLVMRAPAPGKAALEALIIRVPWINS